MIPCIPNWEGGILQLSGSTSISSHSLISHSAIPPFHPRQHRKWRSKIARCTATTSYADCIRERAPTLSPSPSTGATKNPTPYGFLLGTLSVALKSLFRRVREAHGCTWSKRVYEFRHLRENYFRRSPTKLTPLPTTERGTRISTILDRESKSSKCAAKDIAVSRQYYNAQTSFLKRFLYSITMKCANRWDKIPNRRSQEDYIGKLQLHGGNTTRHHSRGEDRAHQVCSEAVGEKRFTHFLWAVSPAVSRPHRYPILLPFHIPSPPPPLPQTSPLSLPPLSIHFSLYQPPISSCTHPIYNSHSVRPHLQLHGNPTPPHRTLPHSQLHPMIPILPYPIPAIPLCHNLTPPYHTPVPPQPVSHSSQPPSTAPYHTPPTSTHIHIPPFLSAESPSRSPSPPSPLPAHSLPPTSPLRQSSQNPSRPLHRYKFPYGDTVDLLVYQRRAHGLRSRVKISRRTEEGFMKMYT